jgi:thiol-disulfide isomerase/thioredoxin
MTRSVPPQPKYADVKFSDYVGKGKYILVDFWAPWCGPCKREIPNLKAVYDKYAGKNFDILSIAVWERQPVQVTIDTAAELGMNWSHINNAGSVPTEIYGIEGIPHLMLIGPDGTILKRGFHGAEGINAAVAEYLD